MTKRSNRRLATFGKIWGCIGMSDDQREYGLVKSFDIDNGELDGLRPVDCFVLGYELAQIDALVKVDVQFERPVHAANRERIEKSCKDAGRAFTLRWMEGDSSETWMWLRVAPREVTW